MSKPAATPTVRIRGGGGIGKTTITTPIPAEAFIPAADPRPKENH